MTNAIRTEPQRRWFIGATVAIVGGAAFYLSSAKPSVAVEVGRLVAPTERVSIDAIDHSTWDQLLQKYVDDEGRVDYKNWHATATDISHLDSYLNHLSAANLKAKASRESQLAYWINAYNAVTIKGILREYPTDSIKNHTALFGYNIWKHLLLQSGDTKISLNDMEHKVLRKMSEPRIHFAIVCASIGCPRLLNEAYTGDRLDEQLNANAEHFFAQQRNFRVDPAANTVYLSSILDWFGEDFGKNIASQLATIAKYLPSDEARRMAAGSKVRVKYLEYDWGLNAQTK